MQTLFRFPLLLVAGHDLQFMRVTSTVLSTSKIAWQTKEVAEKPSVVEKCRDHGTRGIPPDENFASPKTPGLQEVKKQAARRSGRLSTISGSLSHTLHSIALRFGPKKTIYKNKQESS